MAKQSTKERSAGYSEILADIKSGNYSPYYLLMGEEPWYSDNIAAEITANALTEDEKGFNYHLFYGGDCNDVTVVEASRRFPMMASRQLVVLKEAQLLKNLDAFAAYFSQPMPSTILLIVFTGKSADKRGSFYKSALAGNGVVFESVALKDNQIPSWIENFARSEGYNTDPQASMLLAEFCGPDLRKLSTELHKLFNATGADSKLITAELVEQNTGVSREYNAFELGRAITNGNSAQAFKIVMHFGTNPRLYPLQLTLGSLFYHFSRLLKYHSVDQSLRGNTGAMASALGLNPYFLRDIETGARRYNLRRTMEAVALIRKCDSMSKSNERGEASDSDLLRELVTRLIYSPTTR